MIDGLLNNYFWAPTKDTLNDPCEGYYSTEAYDLFIRIAQKITPNVNSSELNNQFKLIQENIASLGIFSLSKSFAIHSLWAHYADNHKGICIEYDLEELTAKNRHLYQCINVIYSKNPPDIGTSDISNDQLLQKMIGTKHLSWASEQEFRIICDIQGKNYYRSDAVKSIILGSNTTNENKNKLMKLMCNRNIQFKQLIKSDSNYELYTQNIDNPFDSKNDLEENKIQFEYIIPDESYIKDEYRPFAPYLYKVGKIMNSYSDCEELVNIDFSETSTPADPVIYVTFKEKGSNLPYSKKLFKVNELVSSVT